MSVASSIRVVHFADRLVLEAGGSYSQPSDAFEDDTGGGAGGDGIGSGPEDSIGSASGAADRYLVFDLHEESDERAETGSERNSETASAVAAAARNQPPFETTDRVAALGDDEDKVVGIDYALGFLGMVRMPSGLYIVLVQEVRFVGVVFRTKVYALTKVLLFKAHGAESRKADKDAASAIVGLLESGYIYFSYEGDLTKSIQKRQDAKQRDGTAFWWTYALAELVSDSVRASWCLRTIYGFAYAIKLPIRWRTGDDLYFALISRRSRRRCGTRYMARGIDLRSDVANFVETEQVVWTGGSNTPISKTGKITSFVVIRGSIPALWRQSDGTLKPPPEIDGPLMLSRAPFCTHFDRLCRSYGKVLAVSLVASSGPEAVLYEIFERHFEVEPRTDAKLLAFDFHAHCAGREHDRGMASLLSRLKPSLEAHGMFSSVVTDGAVFSTKAVQSGVIRVNCVDCLDRTNVVQSALARHVLQIQLQELCGSQKRPGKEAEDCFRAIWAKNADAISKQYAGTKAMKTDMTRTGKRSTSGMISDGVKSVVRMYYKNMVDEGRQDSMDLISGLATISTAADEIDEDLDNPLWAVFTDAQRVSAGGDRQEARLEIREETLGVITAEGLCFVYPRGALFAYELDDRRPERPRLRLHFHPEPSIEVSAASTALHLQFRKNPGARMRFLRMLLLWSEPEELQLFDQKIRVRMVIYNGSTEPFRLKDLGLPRIPRSMPELLCIVRPLASTRSRACGLAAVPMDVDESPYTLIEVAASTRIGPAIAVLVSRELAPAVMQVENKETRFAPGENNVCAVALHVAGTSLCLVGAHLQKPADFPQAISHISLGRANFDVSSQYENFFAVGILGGEKGAEAVEADEGGRGNLSSASWQDLGHGFGSRILPTKQFALRCSFPGKVRDDRLNPRDKTADGSSPLVLLVDEIIHGRPAPVIPNTAYAASVLLEDLQASGIRYPNTSEPKAMWDSYLTFQCDLALDFTTTKVASNGGSNPQWLEPQLFTLVPSSREEILATCLFGQVMIKAGYGEDLSAGSFVLPLSFNGKFSVSVRLASRLVGHVQGEMTVTMNEVDPLSAGIPMNLPGQMKTKRYTSRKLKNFVGKYITKPTSSRIAQPSRVNDPRKKGASGFNESEDEERL